MKKIVYVLFFCASIESQNVVENLAIGLQNISTQKSKKDSYPLLGPQLLNKVDKNGQKIIVDSDKQRNIYQICVIDQTSINGGAGHCGFHSQRNVLYIADSIQSPFNDFDKIYVQMLDKDRFMDWNKAVSDVTKSGLEECRGMVIKQSDLKKIAEKAPSSFPKNMDATNIVYAGLLLYENDVVSYEERIKKYESDLKDIQRTAHALTVYDSIVRFPKRDVALLNNVAIMDNFIMPIKIDLYLDNSPHGIAVVVHKYNKVLECLIADSWKNQKFSTASNGSVKNVIEGVVDLFILSPEEFKEISIRSIVLGFISWMTEDKFKMLPSSGFYIAEKVVDLLTLLKSESLDITFYKKYYQNVVIEYIKKCNEHFDFIKEGTNMDDLKQKEIFETFEKYLKELEIRD